MGFGNKKQRNELIRLSVTLFLIASIVAILLAVANYFTSPIIAKKAEERINQSLATLFIDADHFELIKTTVEEVTLLNDVVPIQAVYAAKSFENETLGYCIQVTPQGYSDVIDMVVACNQDDIVTGVEILSINDTPGVGQKVQNDLDFQKSVLGINNVVNPVQSAPSSKREIQVIAGATVSSKAYINGVNAAIEVAQGLE